MATVTGMTSAAMLVIKNACIISGAVVGGNLILTKVDGSTVNAGAVTGPTGATGSTGPSGTALANSVVLATTANDSLSGLAVRDGVTPVAADLVLVMNQTTQSANGIYSAASGAWTRWTAADVSAEVASLGVINVKAGTVNGGKRFMTVFKSTDTLGTTAMVWKQLDIDDTGWVNMTLINSWVNFDSGLTSGGTGRPAQVRLKGGQVFFRGIIRTGTTGTSCCALPAQFRGAVVSPGNERTYVIAVSAGWGTCVIDFTTGNMVIAWSVGAGGSYTELSGVGPYQID